MEYGIQSQPSSKPDQSIQATAESILWPHLGRERSQQSYPTVALSQWHIPPISILSAWTVALPQKYNDNRPHLPLDITTRHTQNPKLTWLVEIDHQRSEFLPWLMRQTLTLPCFRMCWACLLSYTMSCLRMEISSHTSFVIFKDKMPFPNDIK